MATEKTKDEYIEELHAERKELRRILEMVYSGVGDDVRLTLDKKDPLAVISIPVLYGVLAKIKAALHGPTTKGDRDGEN